jgi:hypothetical protein
VSRICRRRQGFTPHIPAEQLPEEAVEKCTAISDSGSRKHEMRMKWIRII